ncbi:GDNF family receptor alpha-2 isoform X1 [Panthera pardus]|uniref:GDNF family receptor alpha-2 n=1 Tax=Panthera pardus TaxID=9691 RepID=A0A9W2VF11_PANPR|nr:GDNF family receptor alpha-2 isoform X1 [Panthera pardus]XP_058576395.1 GDNF family receptor alpha-2 isoform X1 [Neofelis nebulosa]
MILANVFCLLFFLDETLRSLASPSSLQGPELHGWRPPVDCVRANELCAAESNCSSRYRTLRQCLAGRDRNTMLANKECQAALEVLQESPLYDCRCKRGMKRELQCLQIYWSIHLGLTEGEEFYEASPYEPVTSRLSDIFRLASIFSGTGADPVASAKSNHCLDAAKACNLNDNCKKLRSSYISICNREISPAERCNRRKCHKALRQFFDRVPGEYTYRMLFCSCRDRACAERRRQTILPSCSYEDKEKPNCLDLRGVCRTDHLCRSRLADFHANCRASYQTLTSCPADNYQACLGSYAGMIGFDMTPNYVDSNPTGIVVSPWCSCRGSGNMEEECEKFLRDFTENPCLRNAIQAFGNGTDVNLSPKSPSFQATQAPRVEKTPSLPDDLSDSTSLGTSVITTCTSVQLVDTTQSNLHIQCNPYQSNTSILHRARTNNPKICTEPEKTLNSQSNLEKENQSRRHHNPRLQAILQSCNHQDSMVLAQEKTLRLMEQNKEPRNGSTDVWPTNL